MSKQRLFTVLGLIVAILLPLAACGSAAPQATSVPTAKDAETTASPATDSPTAAPRATAVPPTSTPQAPTVGGTLVIGLALEPDTLDVQKTGTVQMEMVMAQVGATLITRDPTTGKFVPYLAESWKISGDGLTVDFFLKKGVKFHDGSPLTAADYAWTLNRAIDPATRSVGTGQMLSSLSSAEALDDSTLRLKLKSPNFPLLSTLSFNSYCSPMPRAAVERLGDQFGRQPIGAGPFRFKEWRTGEKIVLERNPDYTWGPGFSEGGPYIQTIEYRIIAEYSTLIAGLEAGELDFYLGVQPHELQRIKDSGRFQLIDFLLAGGSPYVQINVSTPPFDDLKVRKAFTLAVDRQSLIKSAASGQGAEMHGSLSSTVAGYSAVQEKVGTGYDLAQAKALMKEAGYTPGADGILHKDGKPLELTMKTIPREDRVRVCEVLKEQYKALGVEIAIAQEDAGSLLTDVITGKFEICVFGYTGPEADILYLFFASNDLGGGNAAQVVDPELDRLLSATRTTMDPEKRQQAVDATVTRLIEQVYEIPLYSPKSYVALSNRVKGALYSPVTLELWLNDAYIAAK